MNRSEAAIKQEQLIEDKVARRICAEAGEELPMYDGTNTATIMAVQMMRDFKAVAETSLAENKEARKCIEKLYGICCSSEDDLVAGNIGGFQVLQIFAKEINSFYESMPHLRKPGRLGVE